jgi:hypothetical protein
MLCIMQDMSTQTLLFEFTVSDVKNKKVERVRQMTKTITFNVIL